MSVNNNYIHISTQDRAGQYYALFIQSNWNKTMPHCIGESCPILYQIYKHKC